MPDVNLDAVDAVELAGLLRFVGDWLGDDKDQLGAGKSGRPAGLAERNPGHFGQRVTSTIPVAVAPVVWSRTTTR